jgi:hypothetical protein
MVLEGLFGATGDVAVEVGRRLLAARAVPALVELRSRGVSAGRPPGPAARP